MRHALTLLALLMSMMLATLSHAQERPEKPPSEEQMVIRELTVELELLTKSLSKQAALRLLEQGKRLQSEQEQARTQARLEELAREAGRRDAELAAELARQRRMRWVFMSASFVGGVLAAGVVVKLVQ